MRDKLREMDIRITELCDYLHFSRPTMYRFIDNYEAGKTRGIDRGVLGLFNYIENTPNIGKKNVISYIINNISSDNEDETSQLQKAVVRYESGKSVSEKKSEAIKKLLSSSEFDDVLFYINECSDIIDKKEYSEEDLQKIGRLVILRDDIRNEKKLTKTQLERINRILEGE